MVQIAYLLLCHRDPDAVAAQAKGLAAAGDRVAIHFDGGAGQDAYLRLVEGVAGIPGIVLTPRRIRCGWGTWSLVAATLEAARTALAAFPDATHFYLVSNDCAPTKSALHARAFLARDDADHIEHHDFFDSDWIRTGLKAERLIYRHYVNERRHKALFYALLGLQQRLGLRRALPRGLPIRIGSQWWCLRRGTIERVLSFLAERPDVVRFFRTTWIPDETVFQSLVPHLVPAAEIRAQTPTFLLFTDYGMPATFYNDHYDLLLAQEGLFARKISPEARTLRRRLTELYSSGREEFEISGEGRRLHAYLTGQGRIGRRFAPRFWEADASLRRGTELLILACKKWHVAQRLARAIAAQTSIPTHGLVFDDADCALPDLGGIGADLAARHRHRRALVHLLFDVAGCDRLLICADPGRIDTMRDFAAAPATLRVLEIRCRWSEGEIAAHAARSGLAGPAMPASARAALVRTLRLDLRHESDALDDAGLPHLTRIDEGGPPERNVLSLAEFLSIPQAEAADILRRAALFADRAAE